MEWLKMSKKLLGIICTLSLILGLSSYYLVQSQLFVSAEAQDGDIAELQTEGEVDEETNDDGDSAEGKEVVDTEIVDEKQGEEKSKTGDAVTNSTKSIKSTVKTKNEQKKTQIELNQQPISAFFPDSTLANVVARQLKKSDANEMISETEFGLIRLINYHGKKGPQITNLEGMQYLKNLRTLELPWNNIDNLSSLTGLTQLKKLNLMVNKVTDLAPLQNLTNITTLIIRGNNVSDLGSLSPLTKLAKLDMGLNPIEHLGPIRNLIGLKDLQADFNNISNVEPLSGLKQLQLLDLNQNKLTDINALNGLSSLKELRIGISKTGGLKDNISDFSVLSLLHSLEKLDIEGRGIDRISDDILMRLKGLKVEYSNITDFTRFLKFSNLTTLSLGGNEIEDITLLKDASLPNLRELDLSSNYIIDLTPFKTAQLPQLIDLDLTGQSNKDMIFFPHAKDLAIPNIIKDVDGQLVAPSAFIPAEFGRYEESNIIWSLPLPMRNVERNVSHKWDKKVQIGNVLTSYTGTYQARVYEHFPVTFEVDGGTLGEPLDLIPNTLLDEPAAPNKTGYTFVGWFTKSSGGQKWNFQAQTTPREPLTLYARYATNVHTVIFKNGEELIEQALVEFDAEITEPTQPEKTGYKFVGWFTDEEGLQQWNFKENKMPDGDITLYARFERQYDIAKWEIKAKSIEWNKAHFLKLQADEKKLESELIKHSEVKVYDENGECICNWSDGMFRVTNLQDLINISAESDYEVHLAYLGPVLAIDVEPLLSTHVTLTVLAADTGDKVGENNSNQDNNGSGNVNTGTGGDEDAAKLTQTGEYTNEKLLFSIMLILCSIIILVIPFVQKKLQENKINLKQLFKL